MITCFKCFLDYLDLTFFNSNSRSTGYHGQNTYPCNQNAEKRGHEFCSPYLQLGWCYLCSDTRAVLYYGTSVLQKQKTR